MQGLSLLPCAGPVPRHWAASWGWAEVGTWVQLGEAHGLVRRCCGELETSTGTETDNPAGCNEILCHQQVGEGSRVQGRYSEVY